MIRNSNTISWSNEYLQITFYLVPELFIKKNKTDDGSNVRVSLTPLTEATEKKKFLEIGVFLLFFFGVVFVVVVVVVVLVFVFCGKPFWFPW